MSGTVQLSKHVRNSLLSTFRKESPKVKMNSAVKEPNNVDDLPMTTDDEDQPSSSEEAIVDSSDDDEPSENIQRTIFKRKTDPNLPIAASNAKGRLSIAKEKGSAGLAGIASTRRSIRRTEGKKRSKDDVEDDNEGGDDLFTSKKVKIDSESLAGEVGAHMSSESLIFGKLRAQRGYGKKSQTSTPHAKLKLKRYTSDSMSPERRPELKNRYSALDSSPVADLKLSLPSKTEEGDFSQRSDGPSSEDKSDPPRALGGSDKEQKSIRRPDKKGKKKTIEMAPDPVSQRPQFKMPDAYSNYSPSAELVDLDVRIDDESMVDKRQLGPGMALCPLCAEQVDEKLLQQFSNGERMKLVRQVRFCRMHNKVSAQKIWDERGYPAVDWASLQARIDGHHDFLKSIIMGTRSHFGDLLQENIRTGQARTLLTTKDYLTPGYYGLRGMSVMTETVTDVFSNLLRKRAPVDPRISGRGYTGFVQAVLVPELAVKLIQEDLGLGEDQAREVMTESRAVGEILNDEKRHIHSRASIQMPGEIQEDEDDNVKDENSDDSASVRLEIQETADGVSDVSSPPSYSQRPMSAKAPELDESDSDDSLGSLSGKNTKKHQTSVKKQNTTTVSSRAAPSSKDIEDPTPGKTDEVEDSDDSSSLASF